MVNFPPRPGLVHENAFQPCPNCLSANLIGRSDLERVSALSMRAEEVLRLFPTTIERITWWPLGKMPFCCVNKWDLMRSLITGDGIVPPHEPQDDIMQPFPIFIYDGTARLGADPYFFPRLPGRNVVLLRERSEPPKLFSKTET